MTTFIPSQLDSIDLLIISDSHNSIQEPKKLKALGRFVDYANKGEQDLVIHLGDFVDGRSEEHDQESSILFMNEWNKLRVKNLALTGNHEYYYQSEEDWASYLDYGNRKKNAGSKFNYYESITIGETKYGIITMSRWTPGVSQIDIGEWVKNVLNSTNDDVYIIMEHSLQSFSRISNILIEINFQKPTLYFHGHNHPSVGMSLVEENEKTGLKRYNAGAFLVEGSPFSKVKIKRNGVVYFKNKRVL